MASRTVAGVFSLDPSVGEDVRLFAAVRPVCREMEMKTTMVSRVAFLAKKRAVARALGSAGTDSNGHSSFPTSL
jgi:hypothetical protein